MMTLLASGYCRVEVLRVNNLDVDFSEVENKTTYKKEVESFLNPLEKVELTPDQKRIEELESKLEAFMAGNKVVENVDEDEEEKEQRLKVLKLEYFQLFGKEPHHNKKEERLIEEIDEFKSK